jgi:hypothetical protein
MGSDASIDYVFRIFSSVPYKHGGIPLSLSMLPLSPRMVSFDWNDLTEPLLPSFSSLQILVKANSKCIYRFIIDEGSSASILSSLALKYLGSPKIVSNTSELLDFERRTIEYLGILPQFLITLGGNTFLVNMLVVQGPLDFNMICGHDYVYVMNFVVSTLVCGMYFPHNGRIVTIDHLSSYNHHPNSTLS